MNRDSKAAAMFKAGKALALIEQAQGLIAEAAMELSPIVGLSQQHKLVGDLYDKVKATWHKVNFRVAGGKFDMDSTWKYREQERQQNGGV